jgi:TIR domain
MSYQHDIFISYRRNPETCQWIKEHFVPLLELHVEFELGWKPVVYLDNQVESGTSWPASLGTALGSSRVLILLWTRNYLSSVWCVEELSHMLTREKDRKLRTPAKPYGVVIPAIIHDGDEFPKDLGHVQHFDIQKTFNVRMARNSALAEALDTALTAQAPAIAACIKYAPPWRKVWSQEATKALFEKYYQQTAPVQKTVPRFTHR